MPNGYGLLSLRPVPGASWVDCSLALSDLRDVTAAVQRCRRLLDLDADPWAISGFFAGDPVMGPLAAQCPGRRAVGAVDGNEIAIRAVLGQQVSVVAARRLAGRLVALCGTPLPASVDAAGFGGRDRASAADALGAGALTHVFPDAATIAGLDPATLPMPLARARALITLASALASGDVSLDPGADRDEVGARLLTLPGIGPWTAGYIRLRALSDPDVFLAGDVGVVRALRLTADGPSANGSGANGSNAERVKCERVKCERVKCERVKCARDSNARDSSANGSSGNGSNASDSGARRAGANGSEAGRAGANRGPLTGSLAAAERWRPWRSYATHHLWAVLESAPARTGGARDDAMTAKLLTTWLTVAKNWK